MAQSRQPPVKAQPSEPTRTVRVIEAPLLDLVPVAEGYGPVQPAKVWAAVSQVAGRVVEIHPKLRDGEILAKDTELLRIDPVDYELALAQSEAELAELEVKEQNARASLEIEKRNLELARQELERNRKLVQQGTTSKSAADEAERAMLATRSAVQNLKNTLSLIPAQRSQLQAKADRSARDLEHTKIIAPFDMRVANLKVEADQYVVLGQNLFEGDAVERVEIEAQVAMSSLRRLFLGREAQKLGIARLNQLLPGMVGLDPVVRLDLGNYVAEWEAQFVRFDDTVDPQTRTIGVVVAVDKPFEKVKPGYRPPLSKGMFVQVVLRGKSQAPRVVIPRSAVRNGVVLIADDENRLRRRSVEVLFSQGEVSVISEGLEAGGRVVVSDLVPAVEGMLLQVKTDESLSAALAGQDAGS
jgi:RND family efflux transporter MFP subunit